MMVERQVDPAVDDEADRIVNPRPASKHFSSLAQRAAEHDRLYSEGVHAAYSGHIKHATESFVAAYALLFRRSTLLSLVNMHLKKGNAELAVACYRKMMNSDFITP